MPISALSSESQLFTETRWPRRPYCTNSLNNGLIIRPLHKAIQKPYIQYNPPTIKAWMIFDCDYRGAADAWQYCLPAPTWVTINKKNGHAHLAYGLETPVAVHKNSKYKPILLFNEIYVRFANVLSADKAYNGLITKTPFHSEWITLYYGALYSMNELFEYVEDVKLDKEKEIGMKKEKEKDGRNVRLFNALRKWAYYNIAQYKVFTNLDIWKSVLYKEALEINKRISFPMLDEREVWHTAKSVAKWTWNKYSTKTLEAEIWLLNTHAKEMLQQKNLPNNLMSQREQYATLWPNQEMNILKIRRKEKSRGKS